jgi:hypothetical protein
VIDARLHPADVIAHNEENIGLLLLLLLLLLLHLLRLRSLLLLRGHRHAHHHHRGSNGCEPHGFGNAYTPFPLNRLPELGRQPAPESTARILSPASGGLNCTKGKCSNIAAMAHAVGASTRMVRHQRPLLPKARPS